MIALKALLLLTVAASCAQARRYCKADADCSDLGVDLKCVFSACEWGECGCPRGYASRFVGSLFTFKCVEMKLINQSCSTCGTKGVCAAENAQCIDDKCRCDDGYVSRAGGEWCEDITAGVVYPSETSSTGLGMACHSISTHMAHLDYEADYSGSAVDLLSNSPLDHTPNTCDCGLGYQTELTNVYTANSVIGRLMPDCVINKVGDLCFHDKDCQYIQKSDGAGGYTATNAAVCTNNACACQDAAHTYDISRKYCAPGIAHGAACMTGFTATTNVVCDGSVGLRCGSPCDVATLDGSGDYKCVCDVAWNDNGGTCSKKSAGDSCFGDENCKSLSNTAICKDSKCEEV